MLVFDFERHNLLSGGARGRLRWRAMDILFKAIAEVHPRSEPVGGDLLSAAELADRSDVWEAVSGNLSLAIFAEELLNDRKAARCVRFTAD